MNRHAVVLRSAALGLGLILSVGGCGSEAMTGPAPVNPGPAGRLVKLSGDNQAGAPGATLALPYEALVTDQFGNPIAGTTVEWTVTLGGGAVATSSAVANAQGVASNTHTLGSAVGAHFVEANLATVPGVTAVFHATATATLAVSAGGNNVPDRFSSDLWVHGSYAYTGTWGNRGAPGQAVKIWLLDATGAPALVDSLIIPSVGTVGDVEVSADGSVLLLVTEGGPGNGVYIYGLQNPQQPVFIDSALTASGIHTATFGYIGGKVYAFAAKNPASPELLVYEVEAAAANPLALVSRTAIPPDYGIHDTFVRDGLAVVLAWNTGVIVYDVGNGIRGGSPANPQEVSRIATLNGRAHNAWWFHNPTNGERRYLFVGEEGPGVLGGMATGDLHVVDVSDLTAPREVATYHLAGAGAHNVWMDEQAQILYAAFYNGGVVALDVAGDLEGNLASREIGRIQPGGASNTYTWGVQLHQGSLYAIDMLSGFWQLALP